MIVDPDQEYRIQYKEGWSRPSGLASFGAKVAPSLNGVDLSFTNSVAGSYLKSQVAQISYMIKIS
jgi:hypothetical protein